MRIETVFPVFATYLVAQAGGVMPRAGVIWDAADNLYGTTGVGGDFCGAYGYGIVYKLLPSGVGTVLHVF